MYEITANGKTLLSPLDEQRIHNMIWVEHNLKDLHYLAFDRQLGGFNPLGALIISLDNRIEDSAEAIIRELINRQEICSLFPKVNLSLYPMTTDGLNYTIDLENIDRHFKDLLYLNDTYYKTSELFVDAGHGAQNWDEQLIVKKLQWLLKHSTTLKRVYLFYDNEH